MSVYIRRSVGYAYIPCNNNIQILVYIVTFYCSILNLDMNMNLSCYKILKQSLIIISQSNFIFKNILAF